MAFLDELSSLYDAGRIAADAPAKVGLCNVIVASPTGVNFDNLLS
jgi:hypothetical protein